MRYDSVLRRSAALPKTILKSAVNKGAGIALGCVCVFAGSSPALASENGLSHYATGVNTVFNGILPEPGHLQFYSYSQYYDVDSFKGGDGKSLIPGFKADIKVEAPRLVYTYPINLGSNLKLSSGIIPIVVSQSISAAGRHQSKTGLTDLDIEPLYLSWSNNKHNFFIYGGMDMWAPTGSYHKDQLANLGQNYWTFGPDVFMTWFPNKNVELDLAVVSEFNTTNKATNYHSGSAINIDQAIHIRPFASAPKLRIALQSYYHQQFQDDTINGAVVEDGFRGRAFGIGPQIEYDLFKKGGLLVKYDREIGVENRPRGNKFWLELSFPIL